jgi:hypothetical protein
MSLRANAVAVVGLIALSAVTSAHAQTPPVHRLEVWGGAGLFTGGTVGGRDATERANGSATPFRLFATESMLGRAPVVDAGVGMLLTRRIGAEARLVYGRPDVRTSISADAEGAPALTVVERIDQYAIAGSLVVLIDELRVGGLTPFAVAGAGYLRQLHEGHTVVENGHSFHVGGGVKRWLFTRDRHLLRAAGLRGDARLELFSGGVAFESGLRPRGVISGALFVMF